VGKRKPGDQRQWDVDKASKHGRANGMVLGPKALLLGGIKPRAGGWVSNKREKEKGVSPERGGTALLQVKNGGKETQKQWEAPIGCEHRKDRTEDKMTRWKKKKRGQSKRTERK